MKKNNNTMIGIMFWLTITNIISKILGFGKDILISNYYGSSAKTDALFMAMSIPMTILGIFTSSSDSAIIPQYNEIKLKGGRRKADNFFSTIITYIIFFGVITSLLILIFPNIFINIFAPGFSIDQKTIAEKLLRFYSFFGVFHILYSFFNAYNSSYGKIRLRAILSITTNLIIILGLMISHDKSMYGLSFSLFIAYFFHGVLPVILSFKNNFRYQLKFSQTKDESKKFINNFIPIMSSAFLVDLSLLVDKVLASKLDGGSISALNYGSKITTIFDSIFVIAIGVAVIPTMSSLFLKNEFENIKYYITKIFKYLLILLLPLVIYLLILSNEIVQLVYMRGEFGYEDTVQVAKVLRAYAPQILFISIQGFLVKVLHSFQETKIPLLINSINIVLNIILSIILSKVWGVGGIAFATSLALFISCIILFLYIKSTHGWANEIFNIKDFIFVLLMNILLAIIVKLCKSYFTNIFLRLIFSSLIGCIFYIILLIFLFKSDLIEIVRKVCNRK